MEFEYDRTSGDSVILRGFKYKNELVLVKVTAEQKNRYLSHAYKANIDGINNYFVGKTYNYINIAGLNNKVQFLFDNGNKTVTFQYTDNNGEVKRADGKFNFGRCGADFHRQRHCSEWDHFCKSGHGER